jgi:hypothetical protein
MKLLGLGLSKTGTTSLARALRILGLTCIHFDQRRLNDVLDGSDPDPDFRRYDDVDAVLDLPAAWYFEPLLAAYPDARAVLTLRNEEDWWRSIEEHFNRRTPVTNRAADTFRWILRNRVYGSAWAERQPFLEAYRRHNERVLREVSPERLLVMDIAAGDGWEKLCPFLDLPVPGAPFPHQNPGSSAATPSRRRTLDELSNIVERGARFVLVDEQLLGPAPFSDRRAVPLIERDGIDCGSPTDDGEAIRALEDQRLQGATHLALAWPSFWWLDHYTGFARHLETHFDRSLTNDRWVVFDLRGPAG